MSDDEAREWEEAQEGNALGAIGVYLDHMSDMLEDVLEVQKQQGELLQKLATLLMEKK